MCNILLRKRTIARASKSGSWSLECLQQLAFTYIHWCVVMVQHNNCNAGTWERTIKYALWKHGGSQVSPLSLPPSTTSNSIKVLFGNIPLMWNSNISTDWFSCVLCILALKQLTQSFLLTFQNDKTGPVDLLRPNTYSLEYWCYTVANH